MTPKDQFANRRARIAALKAAEPTLNTKQIAARLNERVGYVWDTLNPDRVAAQRARKRASTAALHPNIHRVRAARSPA